MRLPWLLRRAWRGSSGSRRHFHLAFGVVGAVAPYLGRPPSPARPAAAGVYHVTAQQRTNSITSPPLPTNLQLHDKPTSACQRRLV